MLKKIGNFCLSIIAIFCLSACSSKVEIEFTEKTYQTFKYKNQEYSILNKQISELEIKNVDGKFTKLLVIDKQSKSIIPQSDNNSVTLSLNNIYNLKKGGLCIGINQVYYKILLNNQVQTEELLSINELEEIAFNDKFTVDSDNPRMIKWCGLSNQGSNAVSGW